MWSKNALTERLNLKWPFLQAPMGWLSTPALAAAVSNAGGLGGLGMWGFSAEDAERRIAGFRLGLGPERIVDVQAATALLRGPGQGHPRHCPRRDAGRGNFTPPERVRWLRR